MRKVAAMVGGGEIALSFGLNHHILGDQAKCQMLFVQVVKWREREREGKRGREGQKYTDTTCHHEGQIGGGRDVILHVKYSDWERNTERQRSLWPLSVPGPMLWRNEAIVVTKRPSSGQSLYEQNHSNMGENIQDEVRMSTRYRYGKLPGKECISL